ncbi:methyltransferase domain-containing protein [Mongoliitalea daihaiensis]|nr:methyltransferase domain-containing protein [Mongoliitalea daihaiensis]
MKDWFSSPYFQILYKNRDTSEAQYFIDRLDDYFLFQEGKKVMDLACGRGRHSVSLHQKGLDVTGVDFSPLSISQAKEFEKPGLRFVEADMRTYLEEESFDYVFNMFTSFGFFGDNLQNQLVIDCVYKNLKAGGLFLLDYLNSDFILDNFVPQELKIVDGISFHINRSVKQGHIIKDIYFEDQGRRFHYQESVQLITREMFEYFFEKAGFVLKDVFGDYSLRPYVKHLSERIIFIVEKPDLHAN